MAKCDVTDCEKTAERSLPEEKIADALKKEGLKLAKAKHRSRRANLCKDHYRVIKKHLKKASKIERMRCRVIKKHQKKSSKIERMRL